MFNWAIAKGLGRNFWMLVAGRSVSMVGQQMGSTALTLWMAYHMESVLGASLVQSLPPLLAFFVLPLTGAFADRYIHKKLMIYSDLGAALFTAILATGVFLSMTSSNPWAMALVVGGYCGSQICFLIFAPASEAIFPKIVGIQQRVQGNSIYRGANQLSSITGKSLAGLLYTLFGPVVLLVIDGISYLASALWETKLPNSRSQAQAITGYNVFTEVRQGLSYLIGNTKLYRLLIFCLVINAASTPLFLLLPFHLKDHLGASGTSYGIATAAMTIGSILGTLFLAPTMKHLSTMQSFARLCLGLSALIPLIFWLPSLWAFISGLTLFGFLAAPIHIFTMTEVQNNTQSEYLGRVMAAVMSLSQVLMPIFTLAFGYAVERSWLLQHWAIGVGAVGFLLLGIGCLLWHWRDKPNSNEIAFESPCN